MMAQPQLVQTKFAPLPLPEQLTAVKGQSAQLWDTTDLPVALLKLHSGEKQNKQTNKRQQRKKTTLKKDSKEQGRLRRNASLF